MFELELELVDDLLLIFEFDFIIGSLDLELNDEEASPPNCVILFEDEEPFNCGVTSGDCCIGGKKVDAIAVVIVGGLVEFEDVVVVVLCVVVAATDLLSDFDVGTYEGNCGA